MLLSLASLAWAELPKCTEPVQQSFDSFTSAGIAAGRDERRRLRACTDSPIRVPSFDVGLGLASRRGPAIGGVPLDLGVETFHRGPLSARLGLTVTGFRQYAEIDEEVEGEILFWGTTLNRQLMETTLDLGFRIAPTESLRFEAIGGVLWQSWRQQWWQIDVVPTPIVGVGAEVLLGSVGVRLRATRDLRSVDLYKSDGSVLRLSPNRIAASVFYRYGGTRRMTKPKGLFEGGSDWRRRIGTLPGFRFGLRGDAREGMLLAVVGEVGVEVLRHGPFALEANLNVHSVRNLRILGPPRSVGGTNLTVDGWVEVGEFLALGASAGASLKWYSQQWRYQGSTVVPIVGFRTYTPVVRTRSWSVGFDTNTTFDLVSTQLVIETASIEKLSLLEIQAGLRFQFGHHQPLEKEGEK